MVAAGIAVVHTAVDTGYMGMYSETVVPSETAVHVGIEVQPKTEVYPGIESYPIQYLLAP